MKAKRHVGWVFLGFLAACVSNLACGGGNSTPGAGGRGGAVAGLGGLGGLGDLMGPGGAGGGTVIVGTGGQAGGPPPVTPVRVMATPGILTMDENTSAPMTIKVSLTMPWSEDITLSVSSNANVAALMSESLVFRAGETGPKTILVSAPPDDDTVDNTTDIIISSKDTGSAIVKVNVHDIDVQGIRTSATKLTLTEGNTESLGVRLYKRPASAVVVTLTSSDPTKLIFDQSKLTFDASNYSVFQPVAITPPKDDDALNEHLTIKLSATGNLQDVPVSADVSDIDAVNFDISPTMVNLLENGPPGSIKVALTKAPPSDVTVTVKSTDEGAATVSPATLTFTTADYATPRTVSVTPVADNDTKYEDLSVMLSATGITPAPADRPVGVTVKDTDKQALVVSAPTVVVYEGFTTTFKVRMALQPDANTTVTVFSQDGSKVTIQSPTLYFNPSNYAEPQTVTITAPQDDDLANDEVKISLIGNGIDPVIVTATVMDDDHQAIILDPAAMLVAQESRPNGPASKATVGVRLAFRPTNALTVDLKSSDPTRLVPGSSMSLILLPNNFNIPQFVAFTAAHDDDTMDNSSTITASAPDVPDQTLKVTIVDTDVQNFDIATTSIALMESIRTPPAPAAMSQTLLVKLTGQPVADVKVSFASTLPASKLSVPASCVIHPATWTDGCAVVVSAVADDDGRSESGTITVSGIADDKALTPRTVAVSIKDNDIQKLLVSTTTLTKIEEGKTGLFKVSLDLNPIDPVTISLFSSDPVHFSVPTSVNLTKDNFAAGVDVVVAALDDQEMADHVGTITVQGASAGDMAQVAVSEGNNDQQLIIITPGPNLTMLELGTAQIGVRLAYRPVASEAVGLKAVTASKGNTESTKIRIATPTVTFDASHDYATNQYVTLTAPKDYDMGDQTVYLDASSTVAGTLGAEDTITITDIDVLNFVLTPSTLADVPEGGMVTFDVALTVKPKAAGGLPVQVNVDPPSVAGSIQASFAGGPCVLTDAMAMGSHCTVQVRALQDANADREMATITVSSSAGGITPQSLSIATRDDETQALMVMALGSSMIHESRTDDPAVPHSTTFTVRLAAQPKSQTTVKVSVSPPTSDGISVYAAPAPAADGAEAATFATVTFQPSDWSNPADPTSGPDRSIVIRGFKDFDLRTDPFSIRVQADTISVPDQFLSLSEIDDDKQAFVVSKYNGGCPVPTAGSPVMDVPGPLDQVDEGETTRFCLNLAYQPLSNTTVDIVAASPYLMVTPSLTFSTLGYGTPQTVTVVTMKDPDANMEDRLIQLSSSGFATTRTVTLPVNDKDKQALILSGASIMDLMTTTGTYENWGITITKDGVGDTTVMPTIKLQTDPGTKSPVMITCASSNAASVSTTQTSYSFTSGASGTWPAPQAMTIKVAASAAAGTYTITCNPVGLMLNDYGAVITVTVP
jgi:hypothetical protein